jgi:hypothetical protein
MDYKHLMSTKYFTQLLSNVDYYDKIVQQREDILFFGFFQVCTSCGKPTFKITCQSQDKIPT